MSKNYEHLIGGFAGGVTSTLFCHPLDLLKVRYSGKFFFFVLVWEFFSLFFSYKKEKIREKYKRLFSAF